MRHIAVNITAHEDNRSFTLEIQEKYWKELTRTDRLFAEAIQLLQRKYPAANFKFIPHRHLHSTMFRTSEVIAYLAIADQDVGAPAL